MDMQGAILYNVIVFAKNSFDLAHFNGGTIDLRSLDVAL